MKKIKSLLNSKKGFNTLWAVIIFIAMMIFIAFTFECFKVYIISKSIHSYVQSATTCAATDNAYSVYGGVREGNTYDGGITTDDVKNSLCKLFSLKADGTALENTKGVKWTLDNLSTTYKGVERQGGGSVLNFTTTCVLNIPITFLGDRLPPIALDMTIHSTYMQKF